MVLVYSENLVLPESQLGIVKEMLRLITDYQKQRASKNYNAAVKTCFNLLRLNTLSSIADQSAVVGHLAVALYNSGDIKEAARYAEMGLDLSLGFHSVNHRFFLQTIINKYKERTLL